MKIVFVNDLMGSHHQSLVETVQNFDGSENQQNYSGCGWL